jgi:hypothetical protein
LGGLVEINPRDFWRHNEIGRPLAAIARLNARFDPGADAPLPD